MGLPLAAGLALALAAARKNWGPPLWVALMVGIGLRLAVLVIAARDGWQPYDLANDFRDTADAVLAGHDPLVTVRDGGWHFLPFLAYVLAGVSHVGQLLGIPWNVAARLLPVLADIALIPLIGRLAAHQTANQPNDPRTDPAPGLVAGERAVSAFRSACLLYACVPLAVMVSAIHGQFAPITLLFAVAALLAGRAGRPAIAGLFAGLAVTSSSWAVLVVLGALAAAPTLRHRLTVLAWTAAIPALFLSSSTLLLGTPPHRLPSTAAAALSARPVVGDWGWTAVATSGHLVESSILGRIGSILLAGALLAAAWWWRKADPVTLILALLLVFLVVTYRFGTQYLLWPVPFLIARSGRGTWPALTGASAWAAVGYLYLTRLPWDSWLNARNWWALSSLVVVVLLLCALPVRSLPRTRTRTTRTRRPRAPETPAAASSSAVVGGAPPGRSG
jgi:hypothetical protein